MTTLHADPDCTLGVLVVLLELTGFDELSVTFLFRVETELLVELTKSQLSLFRIDWGLTGLVAEVLRLKRRFWPITGEFRALIEK